MKFSVVLPVYNIEKYLAKCLDSLLHQDVDANDYEIIVVNDSSPDGSRLIAQQYAAQHSNIRIIDQAPNGGVGAARILGIDNARGEYVMSTDSDDWLDDNVLGGMIAAMDSEHLDMLGFRCRGVDERGVPIEWDCVPRLNITESGVVSGTEYFLRNDYAVMITQYVFRREFLVSNNLRMLSHNVHEDEEFTPRAICLSRRIMHYPHVVYNYVRRDGSTMTTFGSRNLHSLVKGMDSLNRFVQSGVISDKRVIAKLRLGISRQLYRVARMSLSIEGVEPREVISDMRSRGLLPMANPRAHLNRFLINWLPGVFVLYNTRIRHRDR